MRFEQGRIKLWFIEREKEREFEGRWNGYDNIIGQREGVCGN